MDVNNGVDPPCGGKDKENQEGSAKAAHSSTAVKAGGLKSQ